MILYLATVKAVLLTPSPSAVIRPGQFVNQATPHYGSGHRRTFTVVYYKTLLFYACQAGSQHSAPSPQLS